MSFTDALRGYAYRVHLRDGFQCVYCGVDGSGDFSAWLHLSWDHLVPKGDPRRDDERFIVTACRFCNEAHNRTRFLVEGKSPEEIVAMKREAILARRAEYRQFWEERVQGKKGAAMTRGPVEQAIRTRLHEGQVLRTPTQRKPFRVGRIGADGLELLLGAGEWPTKLSWECLEGVVPFLRERGTIPIGGRHSSVPNPGTLDEWLKGCTPVTTAGWVAAVLEEAGVVEVIRERPARVRLTRLGL